MKRLLVMLCILFASAPAMAAPFLISAVDTSTSPPTSYQVQMDGGTPITVPATQTTGGWYLHYDLGPLNLSDGNHTVNVSAANVWGASVAVPFQFGKAKAKAVSGLSISEQ